MSNSLSLLSPLHAWQQLKRAWMRHHVGDERFTFMWDDPPPDEWVSLDCETTGLDRRRDEIIAIGAVRIRGNRVMTSPDGITWTSRTSAADNAWYSVAYGDGLFVAVSGDGTDRVMTSGTVAEAGLQAFPLRRQTHARKRPARGPHRQAQRRPHDDRRRQAEPRRVGHPLPVPPAEALGDAQPLTILGASAAVQAQDVITLKVHHFLGPQSVQHTTMLRTPGHGVLKELLHRVNLLSSQAVVLPCHLHDIMPVT